MSSYDFEGFFGGAAQFSQDATGVWTLSPESQATFMQKLQLFFRNHKVLILGGGAALLLVVLVLWWMGGKKSKKNKKKGKKSKKGKKKRKDRFLPFQNQSASMLG